MLTASLFISCQKDEKPEIKNEKQDLNESNLAFLNSDWTFASTGDSLNNQVIGLWLSDEISYNSIDCTDCDSLFTWVIESTGQMVKRNNNWGDHETQYGIWAVDETKKNILFSYKQYFVAGLRDDYVIITDTISIEQLELPYLWTRQIIAENTTLDVKFSKLNK